MFLPQLPLTAPEAATFPRETGCRQGKIRGRGKWAVKSQVVPFPTCHCRLEKTRVFFLWKREIKCQLQMLRGRCERALCFLAVPAPLPLPAFPSEMCSSVSYFSLLAWFYTRKPPQALLAAGRAGGLCLVWRSGLAPRQSHAGCTVTRSSEQH